ncbi:hypothetical protein A2U01_0073947, partial [Trifolium medium]|nr:hypothetical protein [Trifolium medium]
CKSFRSQEKGKNSDFLGGGVGDRKLIKDRLRIRTVQSVGPSRKKLDKLGCGFKDRYRDSSSRNP